ncbi:MAG: SurA N-terminal domain-containing protein [Candidatus Omnitrophota bacterium]
MLSKFRTQHIKKIIWGLVIVIVPAFVLWGAISYIKERKDQTIGKIAGRPITMTDFSYYINMAKLYFSFVPMPDKSKKITTQDILFKAKQYMLLLWKARREKISVSDKEVVDMIKKIKVFARDGTFDVGYYNRFLRYNRIDARTFEEYIRDSLIVDKLYDTLIKTTVNIRDSKRLYRRETQQAKISYLYFPYDKFKLTTPASAQELENFYQKEKNLFREEPKVKIKYVVLPSADETTPKALEALKKIKTIDELKNLFALNIKETDFIGLRDPIEGLGWQPTVNRFAFALTKKRVSPAFETENGYVIIEKIDEKESFIPPLADIKSKVEEKLKDYKAKETATTLAKTILAKVSAAKDKNLKKIADQEKAEYKETGNFKYYDYIEGVGLSEKLSKVIFSLKKNTFYPYPILLDKGAYIVELKDISSVDMKDYEAKEGTYFERVRQTNELMARIKLLSQLEKEAQFRFYNLPQ